MFENMKKKIVSLMLILGILTSFANASVPNAPGPYIGITLIDDNTIRINFLDNSDNETGFIITGDCLSTPIILPANNETVNSQVYVNITDLPCDELCCFEIVAYNADGNSTISDKRCFNFHATFGVVCAEVPNAPGSYIGITDINDTAVRVNFLDNSDNEDGFLVFDRTGDINVTVPENNATQPSQTYVNLDGLTCNRTYFIKALAFNNIGNSETSDERAFNIESTFGITCPIEVPNAPGPYIGVTDINDTAVRVNFLDNSDNEIGFRVFGNDINESVSANDETISSQVYHDIENLICNQLYIIKAVAFNSIGDSLPSDERVFDIETSFSITCP
jgi:hypothetical protein